MRKVTTNDEFAHGILRPITGVKIIGEGKNAVWDMEAIRKQEREAAKEKELARRAKLRAKYNRKSFKSDTNAPPQTQLFQEIRNMQNWDYGKGLIEKGPKRKTTTKMNMAVLRR